ncbi:MAG TPA: mechanosensitive ion channel domain-containing protein [Verrucomicrobiae bacterium]|nr:mechanosensitive ion channel domain-containing protein [Verrucomicrobiae bacterium]
MNTTNQVQTLPPVQHDATVMGRLYAHFGHHSSTATRLMLIVVLVLVLHVVVVGVQKISEWLINKSRAQKGRFDFISHQPKFVTLTQLIANAVTFVMYFFAVGLALQELGVNLTGYLASASIVALAISFGSQGLVQDVVISLTLIFSDAMDVGDMVEIAGSVVVVGHVEEIGLRFTKLRNFFNQIVFVPNRTIANVSRFPQGGIFAYADIQIPVGQGRDQAIQTVANVAEGMWREFGAIILSEPVIDKIETAAGGGWEFVRVHFKIWPGQGSLIETTFRQQIIVAMKAFNPNYGDWQVPVTYRAMTAPKKV